MMVPDEQLIRKIKKNIYGKPQSIQLIFPSGLGDIALVEVQAILANLWFPQKFLSQCTLLKNEIRIEQIHLFAAIELLLRSQCLTDVRLILFEGKAFGVNAFKKHCESVPWEFFIDLSMSIKIKINSIASKAFHESALKEILASIIKPFCQEVVFGENTQETTTIYAMLNKDRLLVSLSLAGQPLYKRGYRTMLSASAPLREDIAAACIRRCLQFANKPLHFSTLLVPFSGTGTFIFEYLIFFLNSVQGLFGRHYALEKMPLFRQEHFNFLLKKAKENSLPTHAMSINAIDNSENANSALLKNLTIFKNRLNDLDIAVENHQENFLTMDLASLTFAGNIFIPLNPPYGIRLGKNTHTINLYKKLASQINNLINMSSTNILGFILCPNEETWLAFSKNIKKAKTQTYHFNQGGLDIRVCQFFHEVMDCRPKV